MDENLAKLTREAARAGQFPHGLVGRRVLLKRWDADDQIEGVILNVGFTALPGLRSAWGNSPPESVWSTLALLDNGEIRPFSLNSYSMHLIG